MGALELFNAQVSLITHSSPACREVLLPYSYSGDPSPTRDSNLVLILPQK